MSALSFSKISAPLNGLLVAAGLVAVAALTTPDLTGQTSFALELLLAGIWAIYVLQLIGRVIMQRTRNIRDRMPAIAVDALAVLVPLAAFLLDDTRDQSLYCAVWLLKPLRDSTFFRLMGRVLTNEARNLIGVTSVFGIILFGAALVAYILERDVQPDRFGSIPQAMWWAVVTLSTTGYGDEIPQSFAGRVLAGPQRKDADPAHHHQPGKNAAGKALRNYVAIAGSRQRHHRPHIAWGMLPNLSGWTSRSRI